MRDFAGQAVKRRDIVVWDKPSGNFRGLTIGIIAALHTKKQYGYLNKEISVISAVDYTGYGNNLRTNVVKISNTDLVVIKKTDKKIERALQGAYDIYWETQGV